MSGLPLALGISRAARVTRKVLVAAGLVAAPLLLAGCVDEQGARTVAEAYGFTDVRVFAPSYFYTGCGKHDLYATGVEATNPRGARIRGVVCSGGWGAKLGVLRIDEIIAPAPLQPVAMPPVDRA